ncbi:MAG: AmmeMemoRadiSam system protein B [Planctomycetes bacterium]|nr:AmmeMemoRadiSam system protein B [Planctomycetota bacterium]
MRWKGSFDGRMVIVVSLAVALMVSCDQRAPAPEKLGLEQAPTAQSTARAAEPSGEVPAQKRNVFQSPLAGAWYEADAETLRKQIDQYLANASGEKLKDVCALILPHAGYRWSGQTAAYGVRQLQGRTFRRVIVLGPSHRVPMENVASVPDYTHYATPLGEVPLDTAFIERLRRYPQFQNIPYAHQGEHSVQIELPLLQHVLGRFQFVPIVVGQLDQPTMRRMGNILHGLVDDQTLVVASSDFTHYGPNYGYQPFRGDVADNLKKLDMGAWKQIRQKDLGGFFGYIAQTGTTICGRHAIGVLLSMLPDDAEAHLLHYDTSGHVGGDYTNSVSYLAIAFTGRWPKGEPAELGSGLGRRALSTEDKQKLLKLARLTLSYALEHSKVPLPSDLDVEITGPMKQIAGAFVTLKKHGELRGCIGEIFPIRPLYKAVMAQAINAGLADRRFPPVRASELDEIEFEISVLTPPHSVSSYKDIVIGRHGIVLKKDGRSAVFLPQVAVEQGWDLETTLNHLARKAGLQEDAWREGASFDVFEAIVFSESELESKHGGR